jgi:hypothetical protein
MPGRFRRSPAVPRERVYNSGHRGKSEARILHRLWSIMNGARIPALIRTICIGAATGAVVGWIVESTGHSPLGIALLAGCSVVAAYIGLIYQAGMFAELSTWVYRRGPWTRYCVALLLTACSLCLYLAYGHNPQDHNYLSLLPTIVLSGAFLGFGPGLVAVGAGIAGVDLIFGAPLPHGSVLGWQLIWPVLACSGLGAVLAFGFLLLLAMYDDSVGD